MADTKKIKWPGFKILDRYITKKFLSTYFFAIALIIIIVVIFDYVEKIDDFVEMKAPFSAIIVDYYINFVPFFINQFSGLFTFISVIFFTSKMAHQTEIIAILSNGVSYRRFMWPYLISAILITALSLSLNLWVIPGANTNRVEFERQFLRKNRNIKYEPHIYRQVYPGTFAYIRNFNGTTNKAAYLSLEQYEGSTMIGALEASNVSFDPQTKKWSALKYVTRTFVGEAEEFVQHGQLDTMINLDVMELGKLEDIVQTMNIGELSEFISQQKEKGSDMISVFEVERQNRFAYPIASIVLTFLGVSLSSRKTRGGTGVHIGIGVALCFTYIMASKFAEEFAKNSSFASPTLLVWLPNIIFAIIAFYFYRKAAR